MTNVHNPWIQITLYNGVSLTWRGSEDRPDYFESLENTRAVDEASRISLSLTYVPHVGEDCNRIEQAIVDNPHCKIQYGDSFDGKEVSSLVYQGLIYSYKITFDNDCLNYSINIISSSASYIHNKVSSTTLRPQKKTIQIRQYDYIELDYQLYSLEVRNKIHDIMTESGLINEYNLDTLLASFPNSWETAETIKVESGSAIEVIKNILNSLPDASEHRRQVVIDDTIKYGKGTLKIVDTDQLLTINKTFKLNDRDCNVISWSPEYNGSVAIFSKNSSTNLDVTSCYDPDTGKSISISYPKAAEIERELTGVSPVQFVNKVQTSVEEFKKFADYPYRATMTTFGKSGSEEVEVGITKIQITPVIMGVAHHSAGTYKILQMTDRVDKDGFTTTYTLLKDTEKKKETSVEVTSYIGGAKLGLGGGAVYHQRRNEIN